MPATPSLDAGSPNEGAAAVLMRRDDAERRNLRDLVNLMAVSVVSRASDDWFVPGVSFQSAKRTSLTERAAHEAYQAAGHRA